jgi:predicted RNA methylase
MKIKINDYANSMFRYDVLTDVWIDQCALYLKNIFGDKLENSVVLDYAFGRGNWSVAFLRAGAKKVISIDASEDNVVRFQNYIDVNEVENIEVIHGNFVEDYDYNFKIDIFWVYGILHHIENEIDFLKALSHFEKSDSLYYIYVYPKNSLRYFLVNNSRKLHTYKNELEYRKSSQYYIHEAQMRARDDLTAPHIKWYTKKTLKDTLFAAGLYINKEDTDFYHFQNATLNIEFNPIQFQCSKNKVNINIKDNNVKEELKLLQVLFDEIYNNINAIGISKESLVIGLHNTYYASLNKKTEDEVIKKCLYI